MAVTGNHQSGEPHMGLRVADAMRHGLLSCREDQHLGDAARTMAEARVHMVAVTSTEDGSVIGVVGDIAMIDGLLDDAPEEKPLSELADRDPVTISSGAPLQEAARLTRDRRVAHLLVRDAQSGHATGVVSTPDIAGLLAAG